MKFNKKIFLWEFAGFWFIGLVGAALHYTFELSGFWRPIALISAVNESTWEHLKMVFWPGLVFALVEYTYIKDEARNFLIAKALSLFIMPAVITVGWYAYTPFTGRSVFPLDLLLFYLAVLAGQVVSYIILTRPNMVASRRQIALAGIVLMTAAFSLFTYFPPHIFLFEHFDLLDTGQFGILDNYDDLLIFTRPAP